MDIARPDLARKKRTRRSLYGVGISVVVIRPGAAVTPDTIIVKLSNYGSRKRRPKISSSTRARRSIHGTESSRDT